jgi:casein kinase II subunit beta
VLCNSQPLLPVGLSDIAYEETVKLYCGRCEDLYIPKSPRHGSIDGAYFGTTFPHLLFLVYPTLIPPKSGPCDLVSSGVGHEAAKRRRRMLDEPDMTEKGIGEVSTASVALKADRYHPMTYGFKVKETAKLQRWQQANRDRYSMIALSSIGVITDMLPSV